MLPPFGWKADPSGKQRLVVYEPEALLVRTMFKLAHNGDSPQAIADLLNTAGIPDPGERMHPDYPERFFRYMKWDHPVIEPIIDKKEFYEVQEKLEKLEKPRGPSSPRKGKRRR